MGPKRKNRLIAGDGDDGLIGGRGADTMRGGDGSDTFLFDDGDARRRDVILDFDPTEGDIIRIGTMQLGDTPGFEDLTLKDVRGGTLVKWGRDKVLLKGIDPDALDASDFDIYNSDPFAV